MLHDPLTKIEKYTEYVLQDIDACGDTGDPHPFERKSDALAALAALTLPNGEVVAACVERVKRSGSEAAGVLTSDEETVAWRGDESALKIGGWIPAERFEGVYLSVATTWGAVAVAPLPWCRDAIDWNRAYENRDPRAMSAIAEITPPQNAATVWATDYGDMVLTDDGWYVRK